MKVLWIALALGLISMVIVIVAGLMSGVVRIMTLIFRAVFAFCMTSAASYFLMMLYDLYEELRMKKLQAAAEAVDNTETVAETPAETSETTETTTTEQPTGFQPMDANNLPNAGR